MDGVLINSQYAHAEAFNLAFEKNNLPRVAPDYLIDLFGPPAEAVVKKLYPKVSGRKLPCVVKDKEQFLLDVAWKKVRPIPGVVIALEKLKKKFDLALITNAQHSEIYQLLKAGEVDPRFFDIIIGANDISFPKPNPASIRKVETLLKDKVLFVVGDRVEDVKLAKNSGATAIAIDSKSEDLNDLSAAGADYIIKSVSLLPEIIAEIVSKQ